MLAALDRRLAPLYAAAALMAVTRPQIGVHFPSDVIAGACFGRVVERLL